MRSADFARLGWPSNLEHRTAARRRPATRLAAVGLPDHLDGRLRSYDDWSDAVARRDTSLAEISRRLLGYGVTGVTDATPDLGADEMRAKLTV